MEKKRLCFCLLQNGTPTIESPAIAPIVTNNPISRPINAKENSKRQATPTPFSQIAADTHDGTNNNNNRVNPPALNSPIDITQFNYDDHWQEIEVDLERVRRFDETC